MKLVVIESATPDEECTTTMFVPNQYNKERALDQVRGIIAKPMIITEVTVELTPPPEVQYYHPYFG